MQLASCSVAQPESIFWRSIPISVEIWRAVTERTIPVSASRCPKCSL